MSQKKVFKDYTAVDSSSDEDSGDEGLVIPVDSTIDQITLAKQADIEEKTFRAKVAQLEKERKAGEIVKIEPAPLTPSPPKVVKVIEDEEITNIWKIDKKCLDLETVFRKILGEAFNSSNAFTRNQTGDNVRIDNRHVRKQKGVQVGRLINKVFPPRKIDMSFEIDLKSVNGDTKVFEMIPNTRYLINQMDFESSLTSLGLERIMHILRSNGPHLGCSIVGAYALHVQQENNESKNLLETAISWFDIQAGREFDMFSLNDTLPYAYETNRAFHILLLKYCKVCAEKKCFESALEFSKILLMKDYETDPLGALMVIDSYALKAKQYKWLVTFYEQEKNVKNLACLPNFAYSVAIAYHFLFKKTKKIIYKQKAAEAMKNAYLQFPFVIGHFMDEASAFSGTSVDTDARATITALESQPIGLQDIVRSYIFHIQDIFKLPEVSTFILASVSEFIEEYGTMPSVAMNEINIRMKNLFVGIPKSVKRHMYLYGIGQKYTTVDMTNPFPPKNELNSFTTLAFNAKVPLSEFRRKDSHAVIMAISETPGLSLLGQTLLIELFQSLIPDSSLIEFFTESVILGRAQDIFLSAIRRITGHETPLPIAENIEPNQEISDPANRELVETLITRITGILGRFNTFPQIPEVEEVPTTNTEPPPEEEVKDEDGSNEEEIKEEGDNHEEIQEDEVE
uniref:Transcription factor 25 n=1 Tax=Rhabditophanes sp. KR3021 TaxID=114890 RepID=A0AC35TTU7_9BILA